jgi:hypothetical protein
MHHFVQESRVVKIALPTQALDFQGIGPISGSKDFYTKKISLNH